MTSRQKIGNSNACEATLIFLVYKEKTPQSRDKSSGHPKGEHYG